MTSSMPLALSNSALMILEPMSIPSPVSVKCRYVIRIHVTKCDRTNRKPEFSEISWSQNLASTWSVLIAKYNQRWSRLLIRTKQTIIPFDEISGPIPRIWQCFTVLLSDIDDNLGYRMRRRNFKTAAAQRLDWLDNFLLPSQIFKQWNDFC